MISLKQEQIDWIRADLARRGLLYPPLREEIVDHVCDAVEAKINGGTPFMDAYGQVLSSFGPYGLTQLNQQTLYAIGSSHQKKGIFNVPSQYSGAHPDARCADFSGSGFPNRRLTKLSTVA